LKKTVYSKVKRRIIPEENPKQQRKNKTIKEIGSKKNPGTSGKAGCANFKLNRTIRIGCSTDGFLC